jgi:hypothetical protein
MKRAGPARLAGTGVRFAGLHQLRRSPPSRIGDAAPLDAVRFRIMR